MPKFFTSQMTAVDDDDVWKACVDVSAETLKGRSKNALADSFVIVAPAVPDSFNLLDASIQRTLQTKIYSRR